MLVLAFLDYPKAVSTRALCRKQLELVHVKLLYTHKESRSLTILILNEQILNDLMRIGKSGMLDFVNEIRIKFKYDPTDPKISKEGKI